MLENININILDDVAKHVQEYLNLMASLDLKFLVNDYTRATEKSKTCINHIFVRTIVEFTNSLNVPIIYAVVTDHKLICLKIENEYFNDNLCFRKSVAE